MINVIQYSMVCVKMNQHCDGRDHGYINSAAHVADCTHTVHIWCTIAELQHSN